MPLTRRHAAAPRQVLLLGGTSEIGLATVRALTPTDGVLLAGRNSDALEAAARVLRRELPNVAVTVIAHFEAHDLRGCEQLVDEVFTSADIDVVLLAFGVLGSQHTAEVRPLHAADVLTVNVTAQAVIGLAVARHLRRQEHGTVVLFSSIAGIRARRANYVYGASKAAVDALGTGLAAALHGSGAQVLVVRPGFVTGRMTQGMTPAPLASTPAQVATRTARAISRRRRTVWIPQTLGPASLLMRAVPWPVWRRLPR